MSVVIQTNVNEEKVTSGKDTILHGRVTKKKARGNVVSAKEIKKIARDYKETFKSVFENSGIGMVLVDAEGTVLDVNKAFCNFTGYSKAELLQYSFQDLGHPDDIANEDTLLSNLLLNTHNYFSLEKRYISKQNKVLGGMHCVSRVSGEKGGIADYVLQVVDITRRKALADELNRKNSELDALRSGLVSRINQHEELNNLIGHDLRGPVNNIKLLTDLLAEKQDDKNENSLHLEFDEIIKYLYQANDSQYNNLDRLMDTARGRKTHNIPLDDCAVATIIHEILAQLNAAIFEAGAFVQLDIQVPVIKYPKAFLENVLYNLISNALKYRSAKRIPEILVRTYEHEGKVAILVKDNGVGIDLVKDGSKLFKLNQPFYKGHNGKSSSLYIIKEQLTSMDSTIEVNSKENEGTEFIVML